MANILNKILTRGMRSFIEKHTMADQDICQRWLKVTKSISINDYNHKLKENNT